MFLARWFRQLSGKKTQSRRRVVRRPYSTGLIVESLEERQVLSTLTCVDPALSTSLTLSSPTSGTIAVVAPNTYSTSDLTSPIAQPAPGADPAPAPAPAPALIPPEIVMMDYEYAGSEITVYGVVMDDGAVAGLPVTFSGLLSGMSTTTDADGWFSVTVQLNQNYGTIGATVMDYTGLVSDPVYIQL